MRHDDTHMALLVTLELAVPLRIAEIHERNTKVRIWEKPAEDLIAFRSDILLYGGGKPGETAAVFNQLVRGLATAAFSPGGVTFAGLHWCTEPHAGCPTRPVPWGDRHDRACAGCSPQDRHDPDDPPDRLCAACQTGVPA
jgi:hypothetical protein